MHTMVLLTFVQWLTDCLGGNARDSGPTLPPNPVVVPTEPPADYDPLAFAKQDILEVWREGNREAAVPPMCYTATGGTSNPCWVCHTLGNPPVAWADMHLQLEYAFSDTALTNKWHNLFEDRSAAVAQIGNQEILDYIRVDNYTPLKDALADREDYPGFKPDLDLSQGFDEEGFANDGSGWRALRYKPFLGTFWPTNGNTDDVFVRLPEKYRTTTELYKVNLAILEWSVTLDSLEPDYRTARREVEPISEVVAGFDLDGDGVLEESISEIVGRPAHYAGDASDEEVEGFTYPKNTEFLHSVRYVDPDEPSLISTRMKELRYSRNHLDLRRDQRNFFHDYEHDERDAGKLPRYSGSAVTGLSGFAGWIFQGYIEDENGWLRLQNHEEHRFCMGCHGAVGALVDGTFTMPRKLPGAAGWKYQDLRGIQDAPQRGHDDPEYLEYFQRNRGADELRANHEMLDRFFTLANGLHEVDEAEVRRAALGGDKDLAWLLAPSRARAIELDKAYRAIVKDQDFVHGRDATVTPPANVHATITNGDTENGASGLFFTDGKLALDWD